MRTDDPLNVRTPGASGGTPPEATADDALTWALASGAAPALFRNELRRAHRRRRVGVLAGAVAATVVTALVLHFRPAGENPISVAIASTAAVIRSPEMRTLSDGSTVELRPGAEIALEFGPAERRLVLQAGEAHFTVRSDAARPFVVVVAGVEVRAVGTAFAVARTSHTVDVLVTQGRVVVETVPAANPRPTAPMLLGAGEQAVVTLADEAPPTVRTLSPSEQRDRLDWRVPMLEFARTTLSEAVQLFNRHADVQLSLDPAIGGLQLSGTLRADDTETLLTLLRNEFGLVDEVRPDGGRHLRRL